MATELQAALASAAESTKKVCATSADIVKAAKPGSKAVLTGSKVAVFSHSVFFAAFGGIIVGVAACHLANKYWLNTKEDTDKS